MICVQLQGRLGNQLFQYAFAYAESKRYGTSFYLDKSIEKFILPKYFEVKNDRLAIIDNGLFSINGYKNAFSIHAKRAFYKFLNRLLFSGRRTIILNNTSTAENFKDLKNNVFYEGYFQSETYFENVKDEIRSLFRIRQPHIAAFEQLKNNYDNGKKKAVVHIRRGDYVDLNITLPIEYYKKVIGMINNDDIQFIFISDDPAFIESEFSGMPNKYISVNTEIVDLQFLINADICVLSNSSFSWWGAWLNNNKAKQIFAPKYWFGFNDGNEYPQGVFEKSGANWIQVEA